MFQLRRASFSFKLAIRETDAHLHARCSISGRCRSSGREERSDISWIQASKCLPENMSLSDTSVVT